MSANFRPSLWLALLAVVLLCGCFDVEDELTLKPDGSGSIVLHVRTLIPEELRDQIQSLSSDDEGPAIYPPVTEDEVERFFPPKDFIVTAEQTDSETQGELKVRAEFRSVQTLLASPYGRAHQLLLNTTNAGQLALVAIPGGEALARAAQTDPAELADLEIKDKPALTRKRQEMKFTFRVHLPGAVKTSNGTHRDRTVTWTYTRAGCRDDAEFTSRLGEPIAASCELSAPLAVTNVARLGLTTWTNLTEGVVSVAKGAPGAEDILAAAKFVPETMRITRSVNLSGDGGNSSSAMLSGFFELPPALSPQKWGAPKLTEVTDSLGNSLLIKARDPMEESFGMRYGLSSQVGFGDAQGNKGKKTFTLMFRAPEWKVKSIALIQGETELTYAGGVEVLKLADAIATNAITSSNDRMEGNYRSRAITDQQLTRIGATLLLQAAVHQQGSTTLMLQFKGKTQPLDVQVFDRDGRPWPTAFAMPSDSGETMIRIGIPGKPAPPLSLALAVSSGSASVKIPFRLEQVPVSSAPAKEVAE